MIARCYGTVLFHMLAKRSYANPTSLPELFVFYVKLAIYKGYILRFTHGAHVHPSVNYFEQTCFALGVFLLGNVLS